jgi:osmotically-inducible protein OsmY
MTNTARVRTWTVAAASVALLGTTACNRNEPADTSTVPTAQAPAEPQAYETAEARTDSGITTAVQARYYGDDTIRNRDVDVMTENGVVTLRGAVDSEESKQKAEQLAQNVAGVTRVENQLQVRTEERPAATTGTAAETRPAASGERPANNDAGWITTKIQAQYFTNPGLKPWNIDVTSSSSGVVRLSGEVDDATDKQQAVTIAQNTEGVTRVEDNLRVRGETTPATGAADAPGTPATQPDPWITAKIQAKYFMDGEVKGRDIDVDTANGVVTLKGSVEDETEKRQAEALARNTDGVRDVQNQLTTAPGAAPVGPLPEAGATAREAGEKIEDAFITTKIQSQYFLDADVKGHEINVDTRNGIVTLKGSVASEAQKKEAEQIATATEGVSKVVNQLTVGAKRQQ